MDLPRIDPRHYVGWIVAGIELLKELAVMSIEHKETVTVPFCFDRFAFGHGWPTCCGRYSSFAPAARSSVSHPSWSPKRRSSSPGNARYSQPSAHKQYQSKL